MMTWQLFLTLTFPSLRHSASDGGSAPPSRASSTRSAPVAALSSMGSARFEDIPGAVSPELRLDADCLGKVVGVRCTPVDSAGRIGVPAHATVNGGLPVPMGDDTQSVITQIEGKGSASFRVQLTRLGLDTSVGERNPKPADLVLERKVLSIMKKRSVIIKVRYDTVRPEVTFDVEGGGRSLLSREGPCFRCVLQRGLIRERRYGWRCNRPMTWTRRLCSSATSPSWDSQSKRARSLADSSAKRSHRKSKHQSINYMESHTHTHAYFPSHTRPHACANRTCSSPPTQSRLGCVHVLKIRNDLR